MDTEKALEILSRGAKPQAGWKRSTFSIATPGPGLGSEPQMVPVHGWTRRGLGIAKEWATEDRSERLKRFKTPPRMLTHLGTGFSVNLTPLAVKQRKLLADLLEALLGNALEAAGEEGQLCKLTGKVNAVCTLHLRCHNDPILRVRGTLIVFLERWGDVL